MSFRAPPAPLRKTWRRSRDESSWESLTRDPSSAPCPERRSRPQSAVEGGQLDVWFKHLQRIQPSSKEDQAGQFGDTFRNREAGDPTWKAKGGVSSNWGSSSGGTSLCGSSFGSQESVQSDVPSPPERRDSWEKVRVSQTLKKEQSRVSFLTPVKIGWLPIRRKVMMVEEQGHNSDTTRQVKLKPPITPTLVTNAQPFVKKCNGNDEEVQRSQSKASTGGRTSLWQHQASPTDKQVPEKRNPSVAVGDTPVSWQALKRSWRLNRVLALPGSSPSTKNQTRTNLDPSAPKTFTQTSSVPQEKPEFLHKTTFADPSRDTITFKIPFQRTSSVQPLKASHIETASTTKTLIPENKAGFSSITISSRKVCRSSSLPPTPSPSEESINSNSRQIMVQRKGTIVKVTEQRVTTSPIHNVKPGENQTSSLDTVVHRRKATIIKVTEHRESYTPTNASRNNEHRHSYTEGLHNENHIWTQGNHTTPIDSKPIHKSTLNLMITPPPAIISPSGNPEITNVTPKRSQRPSSCYGNVFGNSEEVDDKKVQPLTRKLSLDSMQRNGFENQNRGLDLVKANGVNTSRQSKNSEEEMVVPPLTLIKTPHADQTPEDVLALNAAAIIANIKLQRQFSKKKTPNGKSENRSAPSPQENSETAVQDSVTDDNSRTKSHATAFVPLSNGIHNPTQNMSLQEALLRSRPDFITRSKRRTLELERRAQERRDQRRSGPQGKRGSNTHSTQPQSNNCPGTNVKDHSLKSRNTIVTKRQQPPSKLPSEVKRRQEEEEEVKKDASLNNRRRAEQFKKKLLDQVLQRSKD